MVNNRNTLVLYTTATCNLNCRYCYIDKNPALVKIDELLDQSFQDPNYYFNFAKKVFPSPSQLLSVELWGGEPSRRLDRAYRLIEQLINYYPNLHMFAMSTNLTLPEFNQQFFGLLDILGSQVNRNFVFQLQLSLDGPTEINDLNRGQGVTELFTKNFIKFLSEANIYLTKYPNIKIEAHFKPTLDGSSIRALQTKADIINYYKFFEVYQTAVDNAIYVQNFRFSLPVPNTACPSPHTVEEGKLFANLVKLTREIERENSVTPIFKYYTAITPFGYNRWQHCTDICNKGVCGTGRSVIGLLPNNLISTCHNGFTQLLSDYKQYCVEHIEEVDRTIDFNLFIAGNIKNDMVFPYEKLAMYEAQIEDFYISSQTFILQNYIGVIQFLARVNQVDKKYLKFEEARQAANLVYGRTSICLRDHLGSTGTKYIPPVGLFKLLLNGAADYLKLEGENC